MHQLVAGDRRLGEGENLYLGRKATSWGRWNLWKSLDRSYEAASLPTRLNLLLFCLGDLKEPCSLSRDAVESLWSLEALCTLSLVFLGAPKETILALVNVENKLRRINLVNLWSPFVSFLLLFERLATFLLWSHKPCQAVKAELSFRRDVFHRFGHHLAKSR